MEKLTGTVERFVFRAEDSKYTVLRLRTDDGLLTAVGKLEASLLGQEVALTGSWSTHSQYGKQFAFIGATTGNQLSIVGLEKYLGSGIIRGIGPSTAKRIVAHFGPQTLEVLEKDATRLTEVSGIGEAKATSIAEAFSSHSALRNAMVFLQGHGISPGYAARIYRHYGSSCEALVRDNPYHVADEVHGIGFKTADRLAQELGLTPTDPRRIASGIRYVIKSAEDQGHCYLPKDELAKRSAEVLQIDQELLPAVLEVLLRQGHLVEVEGEKCSHIYRPEFLEAERGVSKRILALTQLAYTEQIPLETLAQIEAAQGLVLAAEQRAAVQSALSQGVTIITGGPGTGKTTLVKAVLDLATHKELVVALAAPTGRAAKRMTESTGHEAKTLHRLLEFSPHEGCFTRGVNNPLKCDLLIIDEASMVDLLLMDALTQALPVGCRLVLVGDIDQLPPVGAGNVLRDLIDSQVVPSVRLKVIYRQARESLIVANAHSINRGEFPALRGTAKDFMFFQADDPEKVANLVVEMVSQRLPKFHRMHPVDDIQVLSPMRRSNTGVDSLNLELQGRLNPPSPGKPELRMGSRILRLGDKVMQIKNNYSKMVFNGDLGRISAIDSEEGCLHVVFREGNSRRTIAYDFSECDEIVIAYAISVHKSQGSEYRAVVLPFTTQHYMMLQRNLLYTAITRAKELVVIIGSSKAIAIAVRNASTEERYTGLKDMLLGNKE